MTTRYFKAALPHGIEVRSSQSRAYVACHEGRDNPWSWTMEMHRIPTGAKWAKAEEITAKEYRAILAERRAT
jgi:hypothetical protein